MIASAAAVAIVFAWPLLPLLFAIGRAGCVALVVDVCRGNKKRRCLIAAARVATARGTFVSADFRVVAGAIVLATVAALLLLYFQSPAFAFAADGVALGLLPALAFDTTLVFDRVVGHVARSAVD